MSQEPRRWEAALAVVLGVGSFGAGCATVARSSGSPNERHEPVPTRPAAGESAAPERPMDRTAEVEADTTESTEDDASAVYGAEALEDDVELAGDAAPGAGAPPPHPLDGVSAEELERRVAEELESLGSMSIGRTNGGLLLNGVQMPDDDRWELTDPANAWGTQETIDALQLALDAVHTEFPDTPPLYLGHISAKAGGPLSPHLSHQAGRDADVGYFYTEKNPRWFRRARESNLDVARTWAFVRALVTETDVAMILIDHSIQRLLRRHAEAIGEDRAWLDDVFLGSGGRLPIIRHVRGHATHLHVRFYNPIAQETARRTYEHLVAHEVIEPPRYYVHHRVKRGETLGELAREYDTTVKDIRRANGLRSTKIIAGRTYKIPREGIAAGEKPFVPPPRRVPPTRGKDELEPGASDKSRRDSS